MRAQIHRGADEVGGSCVEIEGDSGDRLVLDLGLPLSGGPAEEVALPMIDGLDGGEPTLRGVLVSHGHPDHYGLIGSISAEVPLYMGQAAARILREASFFTPLGLDREPAGVFVDRRPFSLGPFTVTPFLVDHSAFDTYALQVDADGHRLLYTADLRAHGKKAAPFERVLREPPGEVDALLLEGTTIGRDAAGHPLSERQVEQRCLDLFGAAPGLALACYSPQNIDRLASVHRAAMRSDRDLVLDLYGAAVAAATGKQTIPQQSWERVRVYVPPAQQVKVEHSEQFWRIDDLGASRIHLEELAEDPARWVFSFRAPLGPELQRADCLDGARAIWMMWPVYLDGESGHQTRDAFSRLGIEPEVVHASGHATIADLRRLAAAIDAGSVVPIHTDAPQRYPKLFDRVTPHPNGEWWEV